ncbi:MAG: hypothetical protein LBI01_00515 [Elusimicrobium sp.]|jgi:hypothetical protein|nr:hypothetical protein [Elusimicrobium sp.]
MHKNKYFLILLILFLFPVFALPAAAQQSKQKTAASQKKSLQSAVAIYKGLISKQQAYFKANASYAQTFNQLGAGLKGRLSVCKNWCWMREKYETTGYIFSFRKYCDNWCGEDKANNPQCIYSGGYYYCINGGKSDYKLDFFDLHNGPYLVNGNGYGADMYDRIRCTNFDCTKLGAVPAGKDIYYIQL